LGTKYSIGSSAVMILRRPSPSCASAAYSVVVLPLPVLDHHADATVLRPAALGDVELGQHLDATDHLMHVRRCHVRVRLVQDAVDAQPQIHVVGVGLDVDVRRLARHSVDQHAIHELHRVGPRRLRPRADDQVRAHRHRVAEAGLQRALDLVAIEPHRAHRPLQEVRQVQPRGRVLGREHAHRDRLVPGRAVDLAEHHHEVATAERLGQQANGRAVELELAKLREGLVDVRHRRDYRGWRARSCSRVRDVPRREPRGRERERAGRTRELAGRTREPGGRTRECERP
jgi:hypothetical protein